MEIDLAGRDALLIGARNAAADAVAEALAANGARVLWAAHGSLPPTADLLVVSHALDREPEQGGAPDLMRATAVVAQSMAERSGGRIVILLSALGVVPMRRHPALSATAAGVIADLRGLAMRFGPSLLINAVGVGLVGPDGAALAAGDPAMLSHIPLARAGDPSDIANAALFLCDPLNSYMTGQVLTVDGGWSAGYGRDF